MSTFAVLRNRQFRLLFIARMASNFGNGMSPTALAFAIFALPDGNATSLSIVLTANMIPMIFLLPLGGVAADRFGRARQIAVSDIILAFDYALVAFLFLTDRATVPVLAVLMAIGGMLNAMWYPAYPGLPADLVEEEHLQNANSFISLGVNSALILGATAGGLLVQNFGGGIAIMVDALTFFVAGLCVWQLRHTSSRVTASESVWRELRDGWHVFWSYKWVVVIVVAFTFLIMSLRAFEGVLGPLIAKQSYDGPVTWATITGTAAAGNLVAAFFGMKWKPRRPMFVGMAVLMPSAFWMVSMALAAPFWLILLFAFAWGMGIELLVIWWFTALQMHVPKESIGRVSAYDGFGSTAFGPIGLAVAGPLADHFGPRPVVLGCAVAAALAILGSLLSREVRNLAG